MSFDVFVECYGETKKAGLPRERIRALFPVVEEESDSERWVVSYGDRDTSDIYVDAEGEPFKNFMVNRPAGDIRLWEALLAVLRMRQVVLFWPGSPPILPRGKTGEDLPQEFREAMGEPAFVERAEEFFKLLKST